MKSKDCIRGLESLKEHCAEMVDKDDPECIWRRDVEALQYAIDFISGKGAELVDVLKLIQENPQLPVVAMVDSEIVADDDYSRWLGSWGSAYIQEYLVGEDQVHFREEDDFEEVEDTLTDGAIDYDTFEAMTDEEAEAAYAALPWIKAIIVNIDLPKH